MSLLWYIDADESIRLNSEVYGAILSTKMLQNWEDSADGLWAKKIAKATQDFLKAQEWDFLHWPSLIST